SRNNIDIDNLLIAEAHDRALAVVFCDLLNRQVEILISCCSDFVFAGFLLGFRRHIKLTVSTMPSPIRQAEKIRNKSKDREHSEYLDIPIIERLRVASWTRRVKAVANSIRLSSTSSLRSPALFRALPFFS